MTTFPRIYTSGTLAYFDSFSGMLPCKVVKVIQGGFGNSVSEGQVEIVMTSTTKSYSRGERLVLAAHLVVPRPHRIQRAHKYRINSNYYWSVGENKPIAEVVPC